MASPTVRRFSTASSTGSYNRSRSQSRSQEEIIQAYEAEEERIIHVLSRKLEKLREDKVNLENALEQESESHVNRLTRELTALRLLQQQQQQYSQGDSQQQVVQLANGTNATSLSDPRFPSSSAMLEALRRENESLRTRLVDMERDYTRISRINDIFREELIELRGKLGISVDSLIGLPSSSALDPLSQPLHRRPNATSTAFKSTIAAPVATNPQQSQNRPPSTLTVSALPIPRPPSQIHRPSHPPNHPSAWSSNTTPLTGTSPASSLPTSPSAPFAFSPPNPSSSHFATHMPSQAYSSGASSSSGSSYPSPSLSLRDPGGSYQTAVTTPPSSMSLNPNPPPPFPLPPPHPLSYPHVPPPSLSSSLGSPVATFHHGAGAGGSGGTPASSRRNSTTFRVAETGTLLRRSGSISRENQGAIPLSRNLRSTVDESSADESSSETIAPLAGSPRRGRVIDGELEPLGVVGELDISVPITNGTSSSRPVGADTGGSTSVGS